MPVTAKIKAQALKSQDAEELRKVAISQGMLSLFDYGVELAKEGQTTSAEVLRVTRIGDSKELS
jgi:general secretion pathway protein E